MGNNYKKMKKIFYDVETTGLDPNKSSIHTIAGLIEIDNEIVEEFKFFLAPHPKAIIEPEALRIGNVTEDEIMMYDTMGVGLQGLKRILSKYIDNFNPKDKAHLVGFNNRGFDDKFLQMWFKLCQDPFIGSWFWVDSLDVMVLASEYLLERRAQMPSFKLKRVATELGITFDEKDLHNAMFDARLTREIYRIVTGIKIEI